MQTTPQPQNAVRPTARPDSTVSPETKPVNSDAQAKNEISVDGTRSDSNDCTKQVAKFSLEVQAAINEQAAQLFDQQAALIDGSWRETFEAIDKLLGEANALRQKASDLAAQQAQGLREMARALRGT